MADSRPTVLVTESEYRKAEPSFVSAPGLECLRAPDDEADLAAALRETPATSVIVGPRPYLGPLYDALPQGGGIARFGAGHDNIDKRKATAAGLLCTNTRGVLNQSVAEHTMLLVAAAARPLLSTSANMTRHVWDPAPGVERQGQTPAIVGCGGIGRAVARIAALGYGMRVVCCSRPGVPPPAAPEHVDAITNDFAIAARQADFVSLHMTASPENVHFINRERLTHLGGRTWLINTARGSIVDEVALFEALSKRRLAGAALDVFEREPYAPAEGGGDLRSLPSIILTPHIGSNTAAANRRMAERAILDGALGHPAV